MSRALIRAAWLAALLTISSALAGASAMATNAPVQSGAVEASAAPYGYAIAGRELIVIDRHSFAVARRIALDERVDHILAHPDGRALYLRSASAVLRMDPRSWTIDARIAVPQASAWAISDAGDFLYVGRSDAEVRLLSIIDTRSLSVGELVLPGSAATTQIVVASSTNRVFLRNTAPGCCADSLTTVDTERLAVIGDRRLPLDGPIAADPEGRWLYLQSGQAMLVLDIGSDEVLAEIALSQDPFGSTVASDIVFDLARQTAFIAAVDIGPGFGGTNGRVVELALGGSSVLRTIPLDLNPIAMQLDTPRSRLYVTGQTEGITARPSQLRPAGIRAVDLMTGLPVASLPPLSDDPYVVSRGSLLFDGVTNQIYARDGGGIYVVDGHGFDVAATLPSVLEFALLQPLPSVPGDGHHFVLASASGAMLGGQWGAPGDLPLPADYSGDGRADLAVFRPREGGQQGLWYVRNSTNLSTARVQWGSAAVADVPVPADYDGDGLIDFAVWRPAEGEWFVIASASGGATGTRFGRLPGRPVPADYDGDGRADLAVYDSGFWQIFASRDGAMDLRLGEGLKLPVPGDYDGDGLADLAVYSPTTGFWRIRSSATAVERTVQWGAPGDIPVPADYDGDGSTDVAVWRPATGTWWIVESASSGIRSVQWGAAGDRPQPADYDGDGIADPAVYRP